MWALGAIAAAADTGGDNANTAVITALIGSLATVLVAVIGLVGSVLVSKQRNAAPAAVAGEDDDTERDMAVLVRALADVRQERDHALADAARERRRAELCEQRERGGHGNA